jgi:hypothetical protein
MKIAKADAQDLLEKLSGAMLKRGWSLGSIEGLPRAFSKDKLVTPFYVNELPRLTSDGWYAFGGAIGIVHRSFEKLWRQSPERRESKNDFAVHLLIANIKELRELSYVRAGSLDTEVDLFASTIAKFLEGLPQSESALAAVFRAQIFCGRPLEHLAGWSNRQKLAEFRAYVETIAGHTNQ